MGRRVSARLAKAREDDDAVVWSSPLGHLARNRRKELGVSQSVICERAQWRFNQNWLSKIERGEYPQPPLERLQALADGLDLPLAQLVAASEARDDIRLSELGKQFGVGVNPLHDLEQVAMAFKDKRNLVVLTRIARVLLWGERNPDENA